MKSCISLLASLAILACLTQQTEAIFEETIKDFLEELRMRMCHPIPKFGLPALDPFEINDVKYEADNKYLVDFSGSLSSFSLTGLSDFVINDLKITTLPTRRSSIDISMPLTAINSSYTAKGSIARIVNLNGDGLAEGHIDNFNLAISWIFKTGLTFGIRSLTITISIGDLFVNIEEVIEEPRINDFVHALINEMGIELMNDLWVEAQDKGIVQYVENIVNDKFGAYSISDLLKIIGGIVGGGGEGDGGPFDGIEPDCKK